MFQYHKYHALGNDYIVLNPGEISFELTPERIRLICDRHFGVGSDGILLGPLPRDGAGPDLRIYNPDGGEAEKSGNGIRIFSRYLIDKKLVAADRFELKTLGGPVRVEKLKPDGSLLRVSMGTVTFRSSEIPVSGPDREVVGEEMEFGKKRMKATCVSIGNPHCVIPVRAVSPELACELGPDVEGAPQFPNRINLQILQVLDRRNIKIEIWERGAGYTLASGTSSCAAACAAHRLGLTDEEVTVHMPGGEITVKIGGDWSVLMTGSVSSVCEGALSGEFLNALSKLP
ncbi:diaminopimelate epimerase [Caproiciproducens sp. NJN-50]|uniref:diaminopimelate epimerase n=2 Tax=Acutalibacteraceae TaxID=3082771 RepID=UPI0026BA89C8